MRFGVKVDGLDDVGRAFQRYPLEMVPQMQAKLVQIAEIVARDAVRRFTADHNRTTRTVTDGDKRRTRKVERTGEHANSVVVRKSGKQAVVIQAGTPRGIGQGWGWMDFGGSMRPKGKRRWDSRIDVVKGGRYLYPAGSANADRMSQAMENVADSITRRFDLD